MAGRGPRRPLTLTRPEGGNAIDTQTAPELAAAIDWAAHLDVGAARLSATGDPLCVGGDNVGNPRILQWRD